MYHYMIYDVVDWSWDDVCMSIFDRVIGENICVRVGQDGRREVAGNNCVTPKCCQLSHMVMKNIYLFIYKYTYSSVEYRTVPNKRSLRIDKHPGKCRGSRGTFINVFSHFCFFFFTNFRLF